MSDNPEAAFARALREAVAEDRREAARRRGAETHAAHTSPCLECGGTGVRSGEYDDDCYRCLGRGLVDDVFVELDVDAAMRRYETAGRPCPPRERE